MPYPIFDRSRLRIQPLAQRQHDLNLSALLPLDAPPCPAVVAREIEAQPEPLGELGRPRHSGSRRLVQRWLAFPQPLIVARLPWHRSVVGQD